MAVINFKVLPAASDAASAAADAASAAADAANSIYNCHMMAMANPMCILCGQKAGGKRLLLLGQH